MPSLDALITSLWLAKQELSDYEAAISDAEKAARDPHRSIDGEVYLADAADLRVHAAATGVKIADVEAAWRLWK